MTKINELPKELQNQIKDTLKAFDEVDVFWENGEYKTVLGCCIQAEYPSDRKFIGTFKASEVFDESERILNYVNSFNDYPIEYKGKQDYKALKKAREQRMQATFDNKGNIVWEVEELQVRFPKVWTRYKEVETEFLDNN